MMSLPDITFKAPWGSTLTILTVSVSALLLGIVLLGLLTGPRFQPLWIASMVMMPLVILVGAALFTVRGYALTGSTLQVQRLLWTTPIPLTELTQAEVVPQTMRQSIRTWGNGGLFGFVGHFRNATLGPYEAFATDLDRTVVLTFPTRKIVLSPDRPEEFVNHVWQRRSDV